MILTSIGADPELFVSEEGVLSAAIGKLGGSKHEPRMIRGYGIQEDNVLAEFSMPPVFMFDHINPKRAFSNAVLEGVHAVREELKAHNLETTQHTSHDYTPDVLRSYGKAALEFGCDPDMNAYTGAVNPAPNKDSTLRTAGGHVHVGYEQNHGDNETGRLVAKAMDLFLGVPSVLMDPDNRRREMYGKAGAYRLKDYGIEYRTLSNFWIHTAELREWVFEQSRLAVMAAPTINLSLAIFGEQAIQDCINAGDKGLAEAICKEFNINVPKESINAQAA